MQFPIIIEKDEDGYYATCPSLEGCSTSGDTHEQALENIKDAIKLYIQDCIQDEELIVTNKEITLSLLDIPVENL